MWCILHFNKGTEFKITNLKPFWNALCFYRTHVVGWESIKSLDWFNASPVTPQPSSQTAVTTANTQSVVAVGRASGTGGWTAVSPTDNVSLLSQSRCFPSSRSVTALPVKTAHVSPQWRRMTLSDGYRGMQRRGVGREGGGRGGRDRAQRGGEGGAAEAKD